MIENIEELKTCKCGGDSLPNRVHMTNVDKQSVEVSGSVHPVPAESVLGRQGRRPGTWRSMEENREEGGVK